MWNALSSQTHEIASIVLCRITCHKLASVVFTWGNWYLPVSTLLGTIVISHWLIVYTYNLYNNNINFYHLFLQWLNLTQTMPWRTWGWTSLSLNSRTTLSPTTLTAWTRRCVLCQHICVCTFFSLKLSKLYTTNSTLSTLYLNCRITVTHRGLSLLLNTWRNGSVRYGTFLWPTLLQILHHYLFLSVFVSVAVQ